MGVYIATRYICPGWNAGERGLSISALESDCDGPRAVVSLTGQADITDSGWIRLLLEFQARQRRGRLVVDLSRLSSMDWWVALTLTWASRVVSRRGGVLVLVNPQPAVALLLDAAGVPGVAVMSDNSQPVVVSVDRPGCREHDPRYRPPAPQSACSESGRRVRRVIRLLRMSDAQCGHNLTRPTIEWVDCFR
jgi:anti-anti-sigma factor